MSLFKLYLVALVTEATLCRFLILIKYKQVTTFKNV